MSSYISTGVTWTHFFYTLLAVAIIYAIAKLLQGRLDRGLYLREADGTVRMFIRVFLIVLNPMAILLLAAIFVAIWPLAHGLMLGLLILFGFRYIRDYVSGKVLRLDQSMQQGRPVQTHLGTGSISSFGLTALYIQREDGRTRVGYTDLLAHGYTVTGSSDRGGYFRLEVSTVTSEDKEADVESKPVVQDEQLSRKLTQALVDNPYVKPDFRVDNLLNGSGDWTIEISVGLHRAEHIDHLVAQLLESGFRTSILTR
ncbi:MAG: hypothetical protein AB8F78_03565 [Saprospiraceae bacterium]